jgi:Na+/proline symporter
MRLHYFDSASKVRALSWKVPVIKTLNQLGALLIVLVGATAVFPENAERIVLETFKEFYPPAIFALAVSGGLAAMMSTASSLTHGIGAVMSRDITQPLFPDWSEKRHFWIARVTAGGGILAAFVFSQFATGIIAELAIAATALALIIVALILITAVYTFSFVNRQGAILSVGAGLLMGVLVIAYPPFRHPFGIHGGTFGLATSITGLLAGSYLTEGRVSRKKIEGWREVLAADEDELERSYRESLLKV